MLEFCIDITLLFIRDSESKAAIHCKAGKGRTGTMIICYLIFSGMFDDIDFATSHYGHFRTKNRKVSKK
jgi:phosphatidylinositol-3,4,5-trisphosphate 3-phosphatase/dual-specificity protein phosphatase PTEN